MNQELGYLRDELNQMLCIHNEHGSKTINMVLLVWGGALAILGKEWITFTQNMNLENKFLYAFIIATIFFISNLVLYYSTRKYYDRANGIFRIAAYIAVFYEMRPSIVSKVSDGNFCWELTTLEEMAFGGVNEEKRNENFGTKIGKSIGNLTRFVRKKKL